MARTQIKHHSSLLFQTFHIYAAKGYTCTHVHKSVNELFILHRKCRINIFIAACSYTRSISKLDRCRMVLVLCQRNVKLAIYFQFFLHIFIANRCRITKLSSVRFCQSNLRQKWTKLLLYLVIVLHANTFRIEFPAMPSIPTDLQEQEMESVFAT